MISTTWEAIRRASSSVSGFCACSRRRRASDQMLVSTSTFTTLSAAACNRKTDRSRYCQRDPKSLPAADSGRIRSAPALQPPPWCGVSPASQLPRSNVHQVEDSRHHSPPSVVSHFPVSVNWVLFWRPFVQFLHLNAGAQERSHRGCCACRCRTAPAARNLIKAGVRYAATRLKSDTRPRANSNRWRSGSPQYLQPLFTLAAADDLATSGSSTPEPRPCVRRHCRRM